MHLNLLFECQSIERLCRVSVLLFRIAQLGSQYIVAYTWCKEKAFIHVFEALKGAISLCVLYMYLDVDPDDPLFHRLIFPPENDQ